MESLELKKLVEKLSQEQPDLVTQIQIGQKELDESQMEMLDKFVKDEQPEQSLTQISTSALLDELKRQSYEAPARDPR